MGVDKPSAVVGAREPREKRQADTLVVSRSPERAQRVIDFIERLTVPSGVGQGGPFKLRAWQEKFVRDVYEPYYLDNGVRRRVVRRAILSIARKNGKTALIAALVLAHLIGPESVENAEIYSAANDREQAGVCYRVAAQMVRAEPDLMRLLTCVDSTKTIACHSNGSFYRAVSSESGTKHGMNPTVVIYDELAQARSRELYDVLDTSMGARLEPLFLTISTQSNDPQHILSKLIDDGLNANDPTTVCHLYAVPEDHEDIYDPKIWRKANPALGDFRDLADFKSLANKAARMPAEEPKFRNLYLNQRVSPVSSLISRVEWMACKGDAALQDQEPVYLALDLSKKNDLTALAIVSAENGSRCNCLFWKPEAFLRDHSSRDFGGGNMRYVEWVQRGWLQTSPGRHIDYEVVALALGDLVQRYKVLGCAFDRWRIDDLLKEMDAQGIAAWQESKANADGDGLRFVPWGQGFKDFTPAIDALEDAVLSRELVHPGNECLTWNISNAVVVMDPAGGRKFDKDKSTFRIDGAVALAMAMGLKARDHKEGHVPLDVMAMIA
jgi:phage terminase large subunit-like protein